MSNQPVHVAIAILYSANQFLLQLRDNIPGIIYPGCWGLFGGHVEPEETPEFAVKRELLEEISYTPPKILKFGCYTDEKVFRHVFHAPLTWELNQLVLKEGWDMDLFTEQEIQQGKRYSKKANQVRPLGDVHQRILLDFLAAQSSVKKESRGSRLRRERSAER